MHVFFESAGTELVCYDVAERRFDHGLWDCFLPARYHLRDLNIYPATCGMYFNAIIEAIQGRYKDPNCEIKVELDKNNKPDKWWIAAGHATYHARFVRKASAGFKVSGDVVLRRYLPGEFACIVPVPPFGEPKKPPHHALAAGTTGSKGERWPSEPVCKSLEELTGVLQNDTSQITFLMGQPGSGKEIFAQALHYGSRLGRRKSSLYLSNPNNLKAKDPAFRTESVAGIKAEEFVGRLFTGRDSGRKEDKDSLVERLQEGGTIFLDEFDKPIEATAIYGLLLRVLEANSFVKQSISKSGNTTSISQELNNVSWIFAGAFSKEDPRDKVPTDLWSRLKGFISIENSLRNDPNYAATLFLYFYLVKVVDTFGGDFDLFLSLLTATGKLQDVARKLLGLPPQPLKDDELVSPLKPSKGLLSLATEFGDQVKVNIVFPSDRIDSTRAVRQAVHAVYYELRNAAIENPDFKLNDIKNRALKVAEQSLLVARGP